MVFEIAENIVKGLGSHLNDKGGKFLAQLNRWVFQEFGYR